MSEGLQKIAGDRIRRILEALTNNRIVGMLVGLSITAIIQSSSATTVMVVGLANAGLISLTQAIGVVLGANIGTTITAQIISFKIEHYALPAIGIGVALKFFARKRSWQYIGEGLLGFGILFYGFSIMKSAFEPLKTSEWIKNFFIMFDQNPLLGVATGAILTMLIQSSSATVGIIMVLASTGLISFYGSIAFILGDNIGTTITAEIASIGANAVAKRAARAHTIFNVIGVIYILLILPIFVKLINVITPGDANFVIQTTQDAQRFGMSIGSEPYIARHIANAHTLFNVINNLVFLPMINILAMIATWMIPGKAEDVEYHLQYLDGKILSTPSIALGEARKEANRMAEETCKMLDDATDVLFQNDPSKITRVRKREEVVDILQREIIRYLTQIFQQPITSEMAREITSTIHMVNNLERIADHAESMVNLMERKIENKLPFSETATQEIKEVSEATKEFLRLVTEGIRDKKQKVIKGAYLLEDRVNQLEDTARDKHIERLNQGRCTVDSGLIFIDLLTNLEKIGDHCFNIAEAVSGIK
jgi:phosphate:Na+ symporter